MHIHTHTHTCVLHTYMLACWWRLSPTGLLLNFLVLHWHDKLLTWQTFLLWTWLFQLGLPLSCDCSVHRRTTETIIAGTKLPVSVHTHPDSSLDLDPNLDLDSELGPDSDPDSDPDSYFRIQTQDSGVDAWHSSSATMVERLVWLLHYISGDCVCVCVLSNWACHWAVSIPCHFT